MRRIVNKREAKATLSELVRYAPAGDEIIVCKAGKPVTRLVALTKRRPPRRPGLWKGRVWMARDFNILPDEWLDAFEGKERRKPPKSVRPSISRPSGALRMS